MTSEQLDALITALQTGTPLGRLSFIEVKTALNALPAFGYSLVPNDTTTKTA